MEFNQEAAKFALSAKPLYAVKKYKFYKKHYMGKTANEAKELYKHRDKRFTLSGIRKPNRNGRLYELALVIDDLKKSHLKRAQEIADFLNNMEAKK